MKNKREIIKKKEFDLAMQILIVKQSILCQFEENDSSHKFFELFSRGLWAITKGEKSFNFQI